MFIFRVFRIKNFVLTLCALALCGIFAVGFYVKQAVKLEDLQGERLFYLDSASSQGLLKDKISWLDFPRIRGESVRLTMEGDTQELLSSIVERYGAEVLFTEETEGVISYYCYTEAWRDSVTLNGRKVNLHVAVSSAQCVVGAPIIFGGF